MGKKIYIPFNSNDFNNIFSTLSISPPNFYKERDFGFDRYSKTKLNPFDDLLVGFYKPAFPKSQNDVDSGYPVNLVVDLDLTQKPKKNEILFIKDTLYLFSGFELLYRNKEERKEVEIKSLKSVETKFEDIAKRSAHLAPNIKDFHWIDTDLQKGMFSGYDSRKKSIKRSDLKDERLLNKVIGALFGFVVGSQRNLPKELRHLNQLKKKLKNRTSLYVNRLGEPNERAAKQQFLSVLEAIQTEFSKIKSLEEEIIRETEGAIDISFIKQLKNLKLFGKSYYDLIISGLLSSKIQSDSFYLMVEKTKKVSNYSRNPNYLQSYIDRLNKHVKEVVIFIEDYISEYISESDFDSKMLEVENKKEGFSFSAASQFSAKEHEYLNHVLNFFISDDFFRNIDELQERKKEYVKDLGKYVKEKIADFKDSDERDYLTDLYKSFDRLTVSFNVDGAKLDTLKSIALMFTKGRDFAQYRDIVESSSIMNKEIPYAIWGAAFGYASLPKTITSSLFENEDQTKEILSKINAFIINFSDPIKNKIFGGSLEINIDTEKDLSTPNQVNEEQRERNQPQEKNAQRLEKFRKAIKNVTRVRKNKKFQGDVKDAYKEVEAAPQIFSDDFESKRKEFSKRLHKKCEGVKGIGSKTVEKVVKIYDDMHH